VLGFRQFVALCSTSEPKGNDVEGAGFAWPWGMQVLAAQWLHLSQKDKTIQTNKDLNLGLHLWLDPLGKVILYLYYHHMASLLHPFQKIQFFLQSEISSKYGESKTTWTRTPDPTRLLFSMELCSEPCPGELKGSPLPLSCTPSPGPHSWSKMKERA
jgi:hypothetical protein